MYFSESQANCLGKQFQKHIYVTDMYFLWKVVPKTKIYVCNLFRPKCNCLSSIWLKMAEDG